MKPILRSALTVAAVLAVLLAGAALRNLRMTGLFAHVTPGFSGACRAIPGIAGAGDAAIDAADGLVFIAASDRRAPPGKPDPRDGIYTMTLAGTGLTKLGGTPADFHPRALSIGGGGGALTLMAINDRADGKPVIEIFDATVANGAVKLVQRSSIEGRLFSHPSAIAATGPNSFYVTNDSTSVTELGHILEDYAMLPRANVVYFNGSGLRVVVSGLSKASGLALAPDGAHLYAAAAGDRTLFTFETDSLIGNLKQVGTLSLPAGPDKIAVDSSGDLWVAGHANLFAWARYAHDASARAPSQIFKVTVVGGIPQSAAPIYADTGSEIAAASIGARSRDTLVIGSALDKKILDCTMK